MEKYLVKRSKRKTIAIEIRSNGEIWVRAPQRASPAAIEAFLEQKSSWVNQKLNEISARNLKISPVVHQFTTGETFLFLGNSVPLKIVPSQRVDLVYADGFQIASHAQSRARDLLTQWYQRQARAFYLQRIDFYSHSSPPPPRKLRITAARTRWGSCSSRGTISLVWRLILAPIEIIDYVIVHELTHLRIHNHSKDFWLAVEAIMPDYKTRRKWLHENGHTLEIV